MSTSSVRRLRGVARDDAGAVMVLGIFMCVCLVGALWYLAGLGDAILYRERAQEAADAVAFSDAALHARGMNLIVLINVVMACILGVRVALKVAQLVLSIAAAVFATLGFLYPPLGALAGPCASGAATCEELINATREPINEALRTLSGVQDVVSSATPQVARMGAMTAVGPAYEPSVTQTGVAHFGSETSLPIASGSQDKLCKEAGRSVPYLADYMFEKAGLKDLLTSDAKKWLGDKFAWIASTSPKHFCEIGSATGDTDFDGLFDDPAKEQCAHEPDATNKAFDGSESQWEKKCAEYGVKCSGKDDKGAPTGGIQGGSTTPERQAELDRLRMIRDQDARSVKEYRDKFPDGVDKPTDRARCEDWAKGDLKRRQKEQAERAKKATSSAETPSENDVTPKRVADEFHNGVVEAQVAGGASMNPARLKRSARLVRIGAWKRGDAETPDGAEMPSWAQAEFFYDCSGKWDQCNDDQEAMWHLKWRPRLRRWNEPRSLTATLAEMGFLHAPSVDLKAFAQRAEDAQKQKPVNPELCADLSRALDATSKRGVH